MQKELNPKEKAFRKLIDEQVLGKKSPQKPIAEKDRHSVSPVELPKEKGKVSNKYAKTPIERSGKFKEGTGSSGTPLP